MLLFQKPVKKQDGFVSKVTFNNKPVRINIPDIKFVNKHTHVMRVAVVEEASRDTITEYDEAALSTTITNNTQWFHNVLTSEQINEFFRSSLNNSILALLVSPLKEPYITYNGKCYDLDNLNTVDLSNCSISIDIEIQGLYFFSQKFGLRWILRKMTITSPVDADVEDEDALKESVEATWEEDLEDLHMSIDNDISKFNERIKKLEDLKNTTTTMLTKAKGYERCCSEWNDLLKTMTTKITKYYNGSLFYL